MQKIHVLRLLPGSDLKKSIIEFVNENKFMAAWICTAVGSLTKYNIRFANRPEANQDEGHFEILSLSGTLSVHGAHIHICISDSDGKTIGGHLLEGCIIYTTAEIVIQSTNEMIFRRERDEKTGWNELKIQKM